MDIFEIVDNFKPLGSAEEKAALLQYLEKGDEARAARVMNRVGMLDRETGEKCLTAALTNCSSELFAALLEHVPRGEYVGWWRSEARPGSSAEQPESAVFRVGGTLPTLAAAQGKAEHLRLLLDWGCDVNSASLDAATALSNKNYVWPEDRKAPFLRGAPTVRCESVTWWDRPESGRIVLFGLTPLAAAVTASSVSCVRLLLEREGVWTTETPAVSEALVLRGKLWDTEAYRECRRLVLTKPGGAPRPLALWAAIRSMDAEALRDELERCGYDLEEVIRAALMLTNWGDKDRWGLLSVLGGRYPDALRDERVQRSVAAMVYHDFNGRDKPLPEIVEQTLGDTVDLDESAIGAANYSAPLMEECLKRFGEGRRLVMSRDAVYMPSTSMLTASYLRVLLRYVEFRPPSLRVGVSALTAAILECGDVRMIRRALGRGLIPAEEPTEELVKLAGKNMTVRALLLTRRRPALGLAPAGAERDSCRLLSEEEEERVLEDPALRAAASDALLRTVMEHRTLRGQPDETLCWSGFETMHYPALCALRGETDTVVRCAMHGRNGAGSPDVANAGRPDIPGGLISLTLLCCAAAGGQTETVRALLDAGFDPEERDMGQPSGLCGEWRENLSLSPLLCALLWERWDTAALLLERGARCDLTCYTVRRAFEKARGGDVPYAAIRCELGAYLEERRLGRINRGAAD